ncbi:CU044_5270 family protein [Actinomadura namibiensis]|uniref:CU044_5270 family protein n=1 Tax=Actinomadura kijaniata TaxID=46161 RepID=UPI001FE24BB5
MGVTHDEIDLFRRARPEAPAYDPAAKAGLRERLAAQTIEETPVRTRRPVRRFAAVGALTAAMAVGVTVVQNVEWGGGAPGPDGRSRPVVLGPVANAAAGEFAAKAIDRANAESPATPRPDQWGYVKSVHAESSKGTGGRLFGPPDRRVTEESWRRVDGTQSATVVRGKVQVRPVTDLERSAVPRNDYPYLLSLPTDPKALLDTVYKATESHPVDRNAAAFGAIEAFMRDAALPPRLRAAMYGALAKIPGIQFERRAADILGRPGVTFSVVEEGYLRSEIMIDPRTYEYLGHRTVVIKAHRATTEHGTVIRDRPGTVLGWGGLVRAGIVDGAGARP